MPKENVDPQTEITEERLLSILEQSGRPNFTKRRITQLISEKMLPSPRRISHPGSKSPVYVWGPESIEHAMFLYDVIERGNGRHRRFLALWLGSYEVPFEPLLHHWLHAIDTTLQSFTGGAQDPEDALWHLSTVLKQYVEPKWRFSPRPDKVIRQVGIDAWTDFNEFLFSLLAVPDYEPDEVVSEGVRATLQRLSTIAQAKADPQTSSEDPLPWLLSLREIFTLPRYRETLLHATTQEWAQAREDYLICCQLLRQLAACFPRRNALVTAEMQQTLFLNWGAILPPLLLAVRSAGHGEWIDDMLSMLSGLLDVFSDPDIQEPLSTM
ncbi:hypothetical protein KSC_032730 [Ktedonobacter sp. SOSP1-52]|uniref:hypothetical protein n=1 Tax=Ktedonobacter sp. SOSP1-52 TaxID=2778366 RepID=UPI00191551A3|nr:hypothetical protein [Ktedonobacter sp. SOSP1-52]GHO64381.1 hypothetical protein KSC_032730 [Ktedonobacter sp. SOSP1-52]